MSAINRVVITGRLVRDPELRTTSTGKQVVSFTVAVDKRFKPTGDEKTANFFRVTAWEKQAEFVGNYAQKGRMVGVEGRLDQRKYTNKDGIEVETTEIIADNVALLDRPRDDQGGTSEGFAAAAVASTATDPEPTDYDPFAEE